MYNTGQREPKPRSTHHFSSPTQKLPVLPNSCQFHPKVAILNQNLPGSSKCCWCQPENAGFTKKLSVSRKSSCIPLEKISASPSTKSNWFHLKIDVFNHRLVSPKSSRCTLKVATLTQNLPSKTKSCRLPTDLKLM